MTTSTKHNSSSQEIHFLKDQQPFSENLKLAEMQSVTLSSPLHPTEELVEFDHGEVLKQEKPPQKRKAFVAAESWKHLMDRIFKYKRLAGTNPNEPSAIIKPRSKAAGREFSTGDVLKLAAARYVESAVESGDGFSMPEQPFGSMFFRLGFEETEDVELVHLLLASAEKIGDQQYERASNLLAQCSCLSSCTGNPVKRVVYYFVQALQRRIFKEFENFSVKEVSGMGEFRLDGDLEERLMGADPDLLALQKQVPISQVTQFLGVQPIIDSVVSAKRIHLIDLGLRLGAQWSIVMKALEGRSSCSVELLKLSAVGTSEEKIEKVGQQLVSFAENLKLPFIFKAVIVSDMKDIREDLFEIESGEAAAVYSPSVMGTMIHRPGCLENLLKVIKNLKPCIMTVSEVEANHNSRSFINRFIEALFFFGAWFDCLDDFMDRIDHSRISIEKLLSVGIVNIVATEGDERVIRHVEIDMWRSFFSRFGFIEVEPTEMSLYQASLLVKRFACRDSLDIDVNGKIITLGWKGTRLFSFSAWKLS